MPDQSYDVIVIGAGFGGSACAGLLAKRSLKVLLVEKNARAGGKAMSISKNGFTYTAWVVIGAPVVQPDQAARAVRCALGMQQALATLNRQGGAPASPSLRMGIGLHTGLAVVGDIGAESRREFTVIGDAVNVAARLEQLTKQFELPVLVSASTVAAAGGLMLFRPVDRVNLRGRAEAVEVYAPADRCAEAS